MLFVKPVLCDLQCLGSNHHNEHLKCTLMLTADIFLLPSTF